VLKKIAATGVLAAATAGVLLSAGPASAERVSAGRDIVPVNSCYYVLPGTVPPAWCNYPATTYYPPTVYYPGYGYGGWNRWHGGWHRWHR
jgi:hypothetical protein